MARFSVQIWVTATKCPARDKLSGLARGGHHNEVL